MISTEPPKYIIMNYCGAGSRGMKSYDGQAMFSGDYSTTSHFYKGFGTCEYLAPEKTSSFVDPMFRKSQQPI